MGSRKETSGPQFRADRPQEQRAVRTTIVGGRPPGSGRGLGDIPRGIEVLVKKASVDAEFRKLLLEKRAGAAGEIGLVLDSAEAAMIAAVPAAQLETIIGQTSVPSEHRRVFLGKVAATMLAAIGLTTSTGCPLGSRPDLPVAPAGIAPDPAPGTEGTEPPGGKPGRPAPADQPPTESDPPDQPSAVSDAVTRGIRPDRVPTPQGIRPERVPVVEGIRPDPVPESEGPET
jgi:hypothetical protein